MFLLWCPEFRGLKQQESTSKQDFLLCFSVFLYFLGLHLTALSLAFSISFVSSWIASQRCFAHRKRVFEHKIGQWPVLHLENIFLQSHAWNLPCLKWFPAPDNALFEVFCRLFLIHPLHCAFNHCHDYSFASMGILIGYDGVKFSVRDGHFIYTKTNSDIIRK